MVIFIFVILGLIVGSFLNVVINRLNSGKPIVLDRSKCEQCGKKLTVLDLIPILSFVLLKGRCRYCQAKLSWQYPIVEAVTAITFILLALDHGSRITDHGFWFQIIISCFLIVIAVYDFKHYLILDTVILPASLITLVYKLIWGNIGQALLGSLIISGFFGVLYFASKGRWIGFGDVKLGILLGLIFAKASPWFLLFAYLIGAAVAVGLILFADQKLKSRVPFGTILGFSAIIFMLYGEWFINWYLRLLGI